MATYWNIKPNAGIYHIGDSVCVFNDVRRSYHALYFIHFSYMH